MIGRISLVAASIAAAVGAVRSEATAAFPVQFTFAHATIAGWTAEALTTVDGGEGPHPLIGDVGCSIRAPRLKVYLTRSGHYSLDVGGDNDLNIFTVTGIYLGSRHYDARPIEVGHASRQFSNLSYPDPEAGAIVLSDFIGYLAIRQRPSGPWLRIDALLDDMIAASRMTVRYRAGNTDPGDDGHSAKAHITLHGLDAAINWCQTQFAAPDAFRIPIAPNQGMKATPSR